MADVQTEVEVLIENSNATEMTNFIRGMFFGLDANDKIRTFMSTGREVLEADWISARGIKAAHEMGYREFFTNNFLSAETNEKHITVLFPDGVAEYAETLMDEIMYLAETEEEVAANIIKDAKPEITEGNSLFDFVANYKPAEDDGTEEADETQPDAEIPETTEQAEMEIPETQPEETQPEVKVVKVKRQAAPVEEVRKAEVVQSTYEDDTMNAEFKMEIPLSKMINSSVKDYVENKSGLLNFVKERILEEAAKLRPNVININNVELGRVEGKTHKSFDLAARLIVLERQLFVAGVSGTGKTFLASQLAKALGVKFSHTSCTAGMSEAHLLGRMVADGSYMKAAFVDCYENGGVFLFDEVDAADANTMLVINSALANGTLSVPNRPENPTAIRHKDFYCICAANTWGWGSNEYAGRNILDAAFLDRFAGCKILVDYDKKLERELSGNSDVICDAVWKVRDNCVKNKIRRVVSTRAIQSARRQTENGFKLKEFFDTFTTGWTNEEISKAMEGVTF